jgi:spoIIIJ-associated protein
MTGFLGKLFGKKATTETTSSGPAALIEEVLGTLLTTANLDFTYEVTTGQGEGEVHVEIFGGDEELLRAREGQLLDAIQLFLTRVVQHQLKDERVSIQVDNSGYREQANQELTELAEKLKNIALEKGKPVYFRALPPRDRKVIHQYLAEDGRVKSRSIGEGLYKKIKIYPLKGEANIESAAEQM